MIARQTTAEKPAIVQRLKKTISPFHFRAVLKRVENDACGEAGVMCFCMFHFQWKTIKVADIYFKVEIYFSFLLNLLRHKF